MKALITGSAGFIGSALSLLERGVYQAGILAVPHRECVAAGEDTRAPGAKNSVLSDLKSMQPAKADAMRL